MNEDRYYQPQDNNEADEIQERIDYKLKNKNNPYTAENISEAISDDALVQSLETLATLLTKGDTHAVGVVLSAVLFTYWENRSEREVINNL